MGVSIGDASVTVARWHPGLERLWSAAAEFGLAGAPNTPGDQGHPNYFFGNVTRKTYGASLEERCNPNGNGGGAIERASRRIVNQRTNEGERHILAHRERQSVADARQLRELRPTVVDWSIRDTASCCLLAPEPRGGCRAHLSDCIVGMMRFHSLCPRGR